MVKKKSKKAKRTLRWNTKAIKPFVERSVKSLARKKRSVGPRSPWWIFLWDWPREFPKRLASFMAGTYHFEPLQTYTFKDETVTVWFYADRLFVRALLFLIKSSFNHIISSRCFHLKGPVGVGMALNSVMKALTKGGFHYFMRIDISGYYASIDRTTLVNLTKKNILTIPSCFIIWNKLLQFPLSKMVPFLILSAIYLAVHHCHHSLEHCT